jgi:short-subunit dehydrogenase
MAADCAYELTKHNVAFVSIWPGAVQTEIIQEAKARAKRLPVSYKVVLSATCPKLTNGLAYEMR